MKFVILLCLSVFMPKNVCSNFTVVFDESLQTNNITYHIYTRENRENPQIVHLDDFDSLNQSHFSKDKPSKIIIHGWIGNAYHPVNSQIRDAFLPIYDVNIICVDWAKDAYGPYEDVVKVVPSVGRRVSVFIDWLIKLGSPIDSFHLIGFSLGAHVAGSAGRHVTAGSVEYISGLDPAKTHWENSTERIDRRDGKYVEIIHTNTKGMNLAYPFGHNDFYPNGGADMPGCFDDPCRHSRSYEYFADSIDHKGFMADQCESYQEIIDGTCSNLSKLHMGGATPKKPLGVFHLRTNADKPYYQGTP